MFDFAKAGIRYSESRKRAEIAACMSQSPSVRVAIDGSILFAAQLREPSEH